MQERNSIYMGLWLARFATDEPATQVTGKPVQLIKQLVIGTI